MPSEQNSSVGIATNVTRTRVTVLVFNLTIISLMLSLIFPHGGTGEQQVMAHLTSSVALFVGFCLTLLGIFWLLFSQNLDAQGLSRTWPFALGAMTTYLALSQTVTAFMHEYLLGLKSDVGASLPDALEAIQSLVPFDALGHTSLSFLLVMGGAIWILMTYVAPLTLGLRASGPRFAAACDGCSRPTTLHFRFRSTGSTPLPGNCNMFQRTSPRTY